MKRVVPGGHANCVPPVKKDTARPRRIEDPAAEEPPPPPREEPPAPPSKNPTITASTSLEPTPSPTTTLAPTTSMPIRIEFVCNAGFVDSQVFCLDFDPKSVVGL